MILARLMLTLRPKYPFEYAKTRVQLARGVAGSSTNPFTVLTQAVKSDGALSVYSGCSALILVSGLLDRHELVSRAHVLLRSPRVRPSKPEYASYHLILSGMHW